LAEYEIVLHALAHRGVLLLQDAKLPSVASLVAEEPVRGSWWGHPRAREIFGVSEKLSDHPRITSAKIVSGKVTFVHHRLWPALVSVGSAREPWQLAGLSVGARRLLDRVEEDGRLRTDQVPGVSPNKQTVGELAREIEERLLVHAEAVHTESGKHAKLLESWSHWVKRVGLEVGHLSADSAKKQMEEAVRRLGAAVDAPIDCPWRER
jgi:hypothetical protein